MESTEEIPQTNPKVARDLPIQVVDPEGMKLANVHYKIHVHPTMLGVFPFSHLVPLWAGDTPYYFDNAFPKKISCMFCGTIGDTFHETLTQLPNGGPKVLTCVPLWRVFIYQHKGIWFGCQSCQRRIGGDFFWKLEDVLPYVFPCKPYEQGGVRRLTKDVYASLASLVGGVEGDKGSDQIHVRNLRRQGRLQ